MDNIPPDEYDLIRDRSNAGREPVDLDKPLRPRQKGFLIGLLTASIALAGGLIGRDIYCHDFLAYQEQDSYSHISATQPRYVPETRLADAPAKQASSVSKDEFASVR